MGLNRLTYLFIILLIASCNVPHPENALKFSEIGIWMDESEVTTLEFEKYRMYFDMEITSDSVKGLVFNADSARWEERTNVSHLVPDGLTASDSLAPVVHVSWEDACAYCNSKNGRLPSLAEWETLASGDFFPGNIWEGFFPFKDEGMDGYLNSSAPVKSFSPNHRDLYDMHGNVWEWTSSQESEGRYFIKGGSFLTDYNQGGFLPTYKKALDKDVIRVDVGFRCVYDL